MPSTPATRTTIAVSRLIPLSNQPSKLPAFLTGTSVVGMVGISRLVTLYTQTDLLTVSARKIFARRAKADTIAHHEETDARAVVRDRSVVVSSSRRAVPGHRDHECPDRRGHGLSDRRRHDRRPRRQDRVGGSGGGLAFKSTRR